MKTSKYLGMKSDDWVCTHVGVAGVTPKYKKSKDGKRSVNKSWGHRSYYYIFERPTSDHKATKMIRLNANQAQLVLNEQRTVEGYALKKERAQSKAFKDKVSYSFHKTKS